MEKMKGYLYQSDLDFIERAKDFFEDDYRRVTYFTKNDDLIALRYGTDNDSIRLFEFGEEKAFFRNVMKPCPVETIKKNAEGDELKLYIIDYSYQDDKNVIINDTWTVIRKSIKEVNEMMNHNAKAFKNIGYSLVGYRFRAVPNAIDGFNIFIHKRIQ